MATDGTWVSRGYGWILQIEAGGYALFDRTRLGCTEFERGDRTQFQGAFDRVQVDRADNLSLHVRGEISRYDFDRVAGLPSVLQRLEDPKITDPFKVFDTFCEYFRQDYAFFDLRGIDWEENCRLARDSVTQDTGHEELFDVLLRLIDELRDNHVVLRSQHRCANSENLADLKKMMMKQFDLNTPDIGEPNTIARIQPFIDRTFLDCDGKTAGNGAVSWGFVEPGVAYVNVLKLFGVADTPASRKAADLPSRRYEHAALLDDDLAAMEKILDRVMGDLGKAKALILDIRINGGGFDRLGMSIANRFCESERLAFTKEARNGDGFTPTQRYFLTPGHRDAFTKPVYVLTSARTASAGDVLALCMRALPNVTIVGEPTTGILSDNLAKHLPNGWTTSLSNEIYRAPDGSVFEGSGVPVDVAVPVYDAVDFAGGLRRAVDTARELALAANA